jgi:beta-lactamase superfamily II metal-dependent hydrolase
VTIAAASFGAFTYLEEGASTGFWLAVGFALFALVGLGDALTTRVALHSDALSITSNFRRRTIPRAEIEHVTWEAGAGVSMQLQGGQWLRLPDVGNSQATTNSIRAWLKRTA